MPILKRITTGVFVATFSLAGCSGGGGGSSSNDQNNPGNNDSNTSTNAKVKCLSQNLNDLPEDLKKVIELSARAVLKCKANRADMDAYLKIRAK